MWFSVVCTLIDNDMRHQSGQNVVGTTIYHNVNERKCFFSERDQGRDTKKRKRCL